MYLKYKKIKVLNALKLPLWLFYYKILSYEIIIADALIYKYYFTVVVGWSKAINNIVYGWVV